MGEGSTRIEIPQKKRAEAVANADASKVKVLPPAGPEAMLNSAMRDERGQIVKENHQDGQRALRKAFIQRKEQVRRELGIEKPKS